MIYGDTTFNAIDSRFNSLIPNTTLDQTLPNSQCDVLGISLNESNYYKFQDYIDYFLPKTKKLLCYFTEPTHTGLTDFISKQNPDIHFFGDAVLNKEIKNFSSVISWFVSPINYYASEPWAKQLLLTLVPYTHLKSHKFDCLLGNQRPHRDMIFKYIHYSPFKDQFITTYYRDQSDMHTRGIWELPSVRVNDCSMQINNQLVNIFSIIPVQIYNQSYYSIVAETSDINEHNQYTEKVAKPLVAKRPFIVFSGRHYLKNLRKLGFKTFDQVIDESYDNEQDSRTRHRMALRQVEFLLHQDPVKVIEELQSVLDHNYKHFVETDWWLPIRQYTM